MQEAVGTEIDMSGPQALQVEVRVLVDPSTKAPLQTPDQSRENRIIDDILADAYSPEAWAVAWHAYLQDRFTFPFRARCIALRATSPLSEGEEVEVIALASEADCRSRMQVLVHFGGRELAVPLVQLAPIGADVRMQEALDDWRFWVGAGYAA